MAAAHPLCDAAGWIGVAVHVLGDGPAVVMLFPLSRQSPCAELAGRAASGAIEFFARYFTVVNLDFRGAGLSERHISGLSLGTFAEDFDTSPYVDSAPVADRLEPNTQTSMTRRDWWLGVVAVVLAILVHAAIPRYRWQQRDRVYWVRIDRWTGTAELVVPRRPQLMSKRPRDRRPNAVFSTSSTKCNVLIPRHRRRRAVNAASKGAYLEVVVWRYECAFEKQQRVGALTPV